MAKINQMEKDSEHRTIIIKDDPVEDGITQALIEVDDECGCAEGHYIEVEVRSLSRLMAEEVA